MSLQAALFILGLVCICDGVDTRNKRRITAGDIFITVNEISNECCGRWSGCCHSDSTIREINKNYNDAVDAKLKITQNISTEMHNNDGKCPWTINNEKPNVRKFYCDRLIELDRIYRNSVEQRIHHYSPCASNSLLYFNPNSYRTPAQIETAVDTWHKQFINRHRGRTQCCDKEIPSNDPDFTVTILDNLPANTGNCDSEWSEALVDVLAMMRYLKYMESVGRRETCVRGCIGQESLDCAASLGYHIFNITVPDPPTTDPPTTDPPTTDPPKTTPETPVVIYHI